MVVAMIDILGGLAAICSVASFAPQAVKIIRTRDVEGLSVGMYALTVTGFSLWLAYGILVGQWPLMVTNGFYLALSLFILIMLLLPEARRRATAAAIDPKQ
jgi:MtN3 and saliva related transmembrane protein